MTILLVRHGETPYNATRVVQFPDTPLSERGHDQARRVARRLRDHPVGGIVSSEYARARMTAEAIRDATGAPLSFAADLYERNFGVHRGSAIDTLDFDLFAQEYEPPGGESWPAFHARVAAAWVGVERFAAAVDGDTVVVSHGLVCRSLVDRVLPLGANVDPLAASWGNTCVTFIDGPPWEITRLACTEHLEDGGVPAAGQPLGL